MAIIKNGKLSGRVGNLVYKTVNGKTVVASYPRRKRRNFEETEQNDKFRIGVRISSRVYRELKDFYLNLVTPNLYNQLTSFFVTKQSGILPEEPIEEWTSIADSRDIQITKTIRPAHILSSNPRMGFDGQWRIQIPSFHLNYFSSNSYRMPRGITALQNALAIIHYDLELESAQVIYRWESERYLVGKYDQDSTVHLEPELVDLDGNPIEGGLLLAAFSIRAFAGSNSFAYMNNKDFNPGVIMGAWAKGPAISASSDFRLNSASNG